MYVIQVFKKIEFLFSLKLKNDHRDMIFLSNDNITIYYGVLRFSKEYIYLEYWLKICYKIFINIWFEGEKNTGKSQEWLIYKHYKIK
jgi:hypothetical protein